MAERKSLPDYNEDLYGKPSTAPSRGGTPVPPPDYNADLYGKKPLPSILRGGQPFGELRTRDPQSWTQDLKEALQSGFEYLGAEPYRARHMGTGIVGATSTASPMGSILSAADLPHHLGTGQYGEAAWDAFGAIPFFGGARKAARGMPQVSQMRVAGAPPSWVRHGEVWNQNAALAPVVPGAGWSVPSVMELTGRGPGAGARATPITGTAIQAYDRIRNNQLLYHPDVVGPDFASRARDLLDTPAGGSFALDSVPTVRNILNRWESGWRGRGQPIGGSDWDDMRQQLRNLEDKEGIAGRHVANLIDRYMPAPPRGAFINGGPQDLAALRNDLATARGDYRGGETARTVEAMIDRAGTRTAVTHSGGNLENKTRQNMEALGRPPLPWESDRLFGATQPERQAVLAASQPSWMEDQNRALYKLMGSSGGLQRGIATGGAFGLGTAAGHAMGLDPALTFGLGAALAPIPYVAGTAMRTAGANRAVRAADEASALIRSNTPEGRLRAASPEFEQVSDPRGMMRDAMAYALMPKAADAGRDWLNEKYIPYENRQEQTPERQKTIADTVPLWPDQPWFDQPLRLTVRPQDAQQ